MNNRKSQKRNRSYNNESNRDNNIEKIKQPKLKTHWLGSTAECKWQERISELEHRQIELTKSEQKENRLKKMSKVTTLVTIIKDLTCTSSGSQKERSRSVALKKYSSK